MFSIRISIGFHGNGPRETGQIGFVYIWQGSKLTVSVTRHAVGARIGSRSETGIGGELVSEVIATLGKILPNLDNSLPYHAK